jgi:hypothetical protein
LAHSNACHKKIEKIGGDRDDKRNKWVRRTQNMKKGKGHRKKG